jgi:hypothetical protein
MGYSVLNRSVVNVNFISAYASTVPGSAYEYKFINLFLEGTDGGGGCYAGECDATGVPNTPSSRSQTFSPGGLPMPPRSEYGGYWILAWNGAGTVNLDKFNSVGYSVISSSGGYTTTAYSRSNNSFSSASNSQTSNLIILQRTDNTDITINDAATCSNSDPGAIGNYMTGVVLCRIGEYAAYLAGNVYRPAYLQHFVDLNPSAIRFMNWMIQGSGIPPVIRYSNRLPPLAYNVAGFNSQGLLRYGNVSNPSAPDYTKFVVTPGNAATPASMTHGEVVQTYLTHDYETSGGSIDGSVLISAMVPYSGDTTKTLVTHSGTYQTGYGATPAATFNVGDPIQIVWANGSPDMVQMSYRVGTIQAVINSTQFTLDINCNGFTAYSGSGAAACIHITLDVHDGSGNSRGAYPIRFMNGPQVPFTYYGQGFLVAAGGNADNYFVFDKNVVAVQTSTGVFTHGAWICGNNGNNPYSIYPATVPTELIAQLINEIEDTIIAQGKQATHGPISPYINIPHMGMLSFDPDYVSGDNFAVQTVAGMINGANGFRGIPSRCSLFVEFANEIWNPTADTNYLSGLSMMRYNGGADYNGYPMLRAAWCVHDINAAFPGNSQIKHVIGGQDSYFAFAESRMAIVLNDSGATNGFTANQVPSEFVGTALMNNYWAMATAPYLNGGTNWDAANLATNTASWLAAGNVANVTSMTEGLSTALTIDNSAGRFVVGGLVALIDIGLESGGAGNVSAWQLNNQLGQITAANTTSITINIPSDGYYSVGTWDPTYGGKVVQIDNPNQEQFCAAYLGWMSESTDDPYSSPLTFAMSRCATMSAAAATYGKNHINYEGWEQMNSFYHSPANTAAQCEQNAFIAGVKRSQSLATYMTSYLSQKASIASNSLMPAVYTEVGYWWAFVQADSYGATHTTEWSDMSPAWNAMKTWNNSTSGTPPVLGAGAPVFMM